MKEARLVIELLKKRIEYGKIEEIELKETILQIEMAIDKAVIAKENITELLKLKTDLLTLYY